MKKVFIKGTAIAVIAAVGIQCVSPAVFAEEVQDVAGTIGFAKVGEEGACVNVRAEASTETGEIVGYLDHGDYAEILSVEEDGWYRIRSGDVEGYVASWLIATGAEADAIAAQSGYTYASVNAESLNVRTDRSEDAEVIGALAEGAEAEVTEAYDGGAYVRVCLDPDTYGYVSADYVELETVYPAGQTAEQMNAAEASADASYEEEWTSSDSSWSDASQDTYTEQGAGTYTDESYADTSYEDSSWSDGSYSDASYTESTDTGNSAGTSSSGSTGVSQAAETSSGSSAAASANGSAIASYACQFVGNPYVWGGSSLTNGADCSGFTMAVFAHFGISLPHYAASQYSCGTPVSVSNLAAGDLVFFSSSGGSIDHVGIYVGGGSIVHAANASKGICYGSLSYSTPVAACRVA